MADKKERRRRTPEEIQQEKRALAQRMAERAAKAAVEAEESARAVVVREVKKVTKRINAIDAGILIKKNRIEKAVQEIETLESERLDLESRLADLAENHSSVEVEEV